MEQAKAVLGGGCFWCVEAVYARLPGVVAVRPGYAGGQTLSPTYEAVCSGQTGHAEVIEIDYDTARIGFNEILDWFFRAHDPTTPNRQGADVGTQYRSIAFYQNAGEKAAIEAAIIRAQPLFRDAIVTQVEPLATVYPAEDYHRAYYESHRSQGYCRMVIAPKLGKLGLPA